MPESRAESDPAQPVSAGIVGNPRRRGKPNRTRTPVSAPIDRLSRAFAPVHSRRPSTHRPVAMADSKPPECPSRPAGGPAASANPSPNASSATRRRWISIAGSPTWISPARSRTPACSAAVGVLTADDLAAIERGMASIRARDRARRISVVERPRGRSLQHREAPDRAGRRRRQAPAHRALAQRPGRHRPAALAARRNRRPCRPSWRRCAAAFIDLAEQHAATIMPGYTHLQVAQPVTFGHHLLAYEAMFARDAERFRDCRRRVNRLPLGSAALAGTSFPIDRARVAAELGFDGAVRQFARRRLGSRFRDRIHRRRGDRDDARVAASPRSSPGG